MCGCTKDDTLKELPKPEVTKGIRGEQFGIDQNINEETIDQYLGSFPRKYNAENTFICPQNPGFFQKEKGGRATLDK